MSEAFIGELKLISWNFPPKGWAFCNGQLLPINQNQALFSLLGTTYGGNGQTTFALPDLRSRTPVGMGPGPGITVQLGEKGGQEVHTVSISELPAHAHPMVANTTAADSIKPSGRLLGTTAGNLTVYAPPGNLVAMNPASIPNIGGSQPHENRQPYLVLNWIICLSGIFPSRN